MGVEIHMRLRTCASNRDWLAPDHLLVNIPHKPRDGSIPARGQLDLAAALDNLPTTHLGRAGLASSTSPLTSKPGKGSTRRWLTSFIVRIGRHVWRRSAAPLAWPGHARLALLREVRREMRVGRLEEAEVLLKSAQQSGARDPQWLNLMGVLHEARGLWKLARKHYGKAMKADRRFAPAQQNMRRWYELFTFGRAREPVSLGDEGPDETCADGADSTMHCRETP